MKVKTLIKDQAQVRLWLLQEEYMYPVCINREGFVQIVDEDVAPETFTIFPWEHARIDWDIAYEFHSQSGKQITGAGGNALQEAQQLLPMPVPAFRIILEAEALQKPHLYLVKLKTLDTRFVSANQRVGTRYRIKRTDFSWWAITKYEDVTRYHTEPSKQLRMLEPHEADPDRFILEWLDPPGSRDQ